MTGRLHRVLVVVAAANVTECTPYWAPAQKHTALPSGTSPPCCTLLLSELSLTQTRRTRASRIMEYGRDSPQLAGEQGSVTHRSRSVTSRHDSIRSSQCVAVDSSQLAPRHVTRPAASVGDTGRRHYSSQEGVCVINCMGVAGAVPSSAVITSPLPPVASSRNRSRQTDHHSSVSATTQTLGSSAEVAAP